MSKFAITRVAQLSMDDKAKIVLLAWFSRKSNAKKDPHRERLVKLLSGVLDGGALLAAYDYFHKNVDIKKQKETDDRITWIAFLLLFGLRIGIVKRMLAMLEQISKKQSVGTIKNSMHVIATSNGIKPSVDTSMRKILSSAKHAVFAVLPYDPLCKYITALDERVCPICGPCHGVTLPRKHKWWDGHTPPMHHRCRCNIVALSSAESSKIRPSNAPSVRAHKTFGADGEDWSPNPKDYPPEMRDVIKKRLNDRKKLK